MSYSFIQTTARLLARLARYQPVRGGLQKLALAYRQQQVMSAASSSHDIAEVLSIDARPALVHGGTRLNLMVPAVSQRHVFGGIETALQVFDALRPYFDQVRIIVTDEAVPEPRSDAYYGAWPIVPMASDAPSCNHIVAAGARWRQTLAVHAQDYFMATAWWTAHNALALLNWQQAQKPEASSRRMLYLIQDFEPGFYPWSSRYLLAQATYEQPRKTIALINSQWLADYLKAQSYEFPVSKVLQPRLHPALAAARERCETFAKERILLVYGRPGTERNAFSLILASLRIWASLYPQASQWQILSAGEEFAPIDIGSGCTLHSVGKLSIGAYADLLCRTAVGFSLMVSPHPSYPPLEMAAFGASVVVNRFANKDLSGVSPLLVSATPPNPDGFASALLTLTRAFDNGETTCIPAKASEMFWSDGFLRSSGPGFDWAADVAAELLGDAHATPATV
jgi:hypothetical protein